MGRNTGRAKRREVYRPVDPRRIAGVLRQKREAAGLTQAQLAEMLLVHQTLISRWENGDRIPGGPELVDLMALLEFTRQDLV